MITPSPRKLMPTLLAACGCALLALMPARSYGQVAVSSWTLSNANAANSTAYGTYNFDNQVNTLSSITVGTAVKSLASNADSVFVRRAGVAASTGNTAGSANIWEVATSASNLVGTSTATNTLQNVLLGHNALMGVNDLFTNTLGSPEANNNIERVDYYWGSGITVVADQGFAIFDRAANHNAADGFQVAVFTGWNTGTSAPTTYAGTVVEITAGAGSQYSATALDWDPTTGGTQAAFTYQILRFTSGDNLTPLASADATNTQGVFGVYISFADLGIAAGTTVYGYSIMANDVDNTVATLADWTNAANYRRNTSDASGSIDLLGINGRLYVPEPSTYGALFLGLGSMLLGFRRWRLNQRGA